MLIVILEPAPIPTFEVEGWVGEDRSGPARRWIIPSRAVVAEQSRLQAHWRNGAALVASRRGGHADSRADEGDTLATGPHSQRRPRTEAGSRRRRPPPSDGHPGFDGLKVSYPIAIPGGSPKHGERRLVAS